MRAYDKQRHSASGNESSVQDEPGVRASIYTSLRFLTGTVRNAYIFPKSDPPRLLEKNNIDDFGSGVASIDFLRDLSPNYIKLERDYILNIKNKPGNLQIVQHLSKLAVDLGTKVCLKGVEDAAILEITKTLPATNIQGNFYAGAITLDEVIKRYL